MLQKDNNYILTMRFDKAAFLLPKKRHLIELVVTMVEEISARSEVNKELLAPYLKVRKEMQSLLNKNDVYLSAAGDLYDSFMDSLKNETVKSISDNFAYNNVALPAFDPKLDMPPLTIQNKI